MKRSLIIVDPHTSVREMLVTNLAKTGDFEVVTAVSNGAAALLSCPKQDPALVVFELILPESSGIDLLRRLKHKHALARTFVYSGVSCPDHIRQALSERPDGYVHKSDSLKTLVDAVATVAAGGVYISAQVAHLRSAAATLKKGEDSILSLREREILQLVAASHSSKEIASRLGLATKTVENHRAKLMTKLKVHDVAALTRFAMRLGLVES